MLQRLPASDAAAVTEETSPIHLATAISRHVARVTLESTGRGPTQARTTVTDDAVFVVIHDVMTKGERRLAERGATDVVNLVRDEYQRSMKDDLVAGIEQITGRHVIAFLSDNLSEPDVGVGVFLLAP